LHTDYLSFHLSGYGKAGLSMMWHLSEGLQV
jgi:hypothetical protein